MKIKISDEDAAQRHGVTTDHEIMDNGELRFRLKKDDGTGYIRTEAPASGSWQISHYHEKLQETYIVQRGWIAYAILVDGKAKIQKFEQGGKFTTEPGVIHNIYMPHGSIIHTVKHSVSLVSDRIEDDRTRYLDNYIRYMKEIDLERIDISADMPLIKNNFAYYEEYRHFDKLI